MRIRILILIVLLSAASASAQEAVRLTVPITQPAVAVTQYVPVSLVIAVRPTPSIVIRLLGDDGRVGTFGYPCAVVGDFKPS